MAKRGRVRRVLAGAVKGAREANELAAVTGAAPAPAPAAEGAAVTFSSSQELLSKTAAGAPKDEEARLTSLFGKLKRAADRVSGPTKGGARLRTSVLDGRIKELATALTGRPAAKLNFGARLGTIRRQLVQASKLGATRAQIGMIASGSLFEAGVLPKTDATRATLVGIVKRLGPKGAQGLQAIPGAEASLAKAGGIRRTLSSKGLRGAAPFAGLLLLEKFLGARRKGEQQKQEITGILERASQSGPQAFGPLRTVEFIEAMGPEFLDRLVQDPALALAVHERLQSVAQQNLPQGVSVLRAAPGSSGGINADELLQQITGQ